MTNLKLRLKIAFYVSVGALLILYPIYSRLFKIRLPSDLSQNLWENGQYFVLTFFLILICFWSFIFYKILRHWIFENLRRGSAPKTFKILEKLRIFVGQCATDFHIFLERITPKPVLRWFYNKLMGPFVRFLMKHINTRHRLVLFAVFVNSVPRIIFILALGFDIIVYHRFFYSYLISPVLLIPMIERYILFWTELFCENNIDEMRKRLYVVNTKNQKVMSIFNYFSDFEFEECEHAAKNKYYIIKTTLTAKNDAKNHEFFLTDDIVEMDREIYKYLNLVYDEDQVLQETLQKLNFTVLPVIMFGDLHCLFRGNVLTFSTIIIALSYVGIWSCALIYVF